MQSWKDVSQKSCSWNCSQWWVYEVLTQGDEYLRNQQQYCIYFTTSNIRHGLKKMQQSPFEFQVVTAVAKCGNFQRGEYFFGIIFNNCIQPLIHHSFSASWYLLWIRFELTRFCVLDWLKSALNFVTQFLSMQKQCSVYFVWCKGMQWICLLYSLNME